MSRPKQSRTSRPQPTRGGAASRRGDVTSPPTLGAALSELFALKGYANARGDAQLAEIWKELAGERIAQRTVVLGVHRGVLQIGVTSAAMLSELASFHKGRLVEALKANYPDLKLKDIKLRLRGDLATPAE
jgi:hypothetical protein